MAIQHRKRSFMKSANSGPPNRWWRFVPTLAVGLTLLVGGVLPASGFAGTIQGVKFNDLNDSTVRDVNEPGLANETIYIRSMSGGIGTTTVTTDASGNYSFDTQGTSGEFMIWSRIASGWIQTTPVKGTGMRPYRVTVTPDKPVKVDIGIRDQSKPKADPPPNTAPQQVSVAPSSVNIHTGNSVTFTGSFVDPDIGDAHTIEWQFGDGSVANAIVTRHVYSSQGNYTVTLSITDSNGAVGTANVNIVVIPKPNTAPTANAGEDITVRAGEQVQLNGNMVDPDPDDTHTFNWNFGDGSTAESQNASHVYPQPGKFIVTLTVKDNQGGQGKDDVIVTVYPVVGAISFDENSPNDITPPKLEVPASDSQDLLVNITIPGAEMTEVNEAGVIYHLVNIPESGYLSEVGKPQLPMVSRLIAVPKGAIAKIEVLNSEVKVIKGYNLYPAQELLPDKDLIDAPPPVFMEDAGVYGRDEFYPAEIAKLDDPAIIRGTSIAALRVFPVQFNAVTQTLRVYSNIRVKVSFEGGVDNFTDDKVLTPSHEQLFVPLLLNGSTALSVGAADSAYEANNSLLIITHPNFLAAANTLAAWKIKRGIYTLVKTTAEIGSTAAAIQNYIKTAYTSATASKPPPSYVLFIGDAEFIPTHYVTTHPYHDFKTGTDLYYATVDGNDYFPDIYLGRLSVDTLTQATKRVKDIIGYEKAVVADSSFYKKATVAAYFQDYLWPSGKADRRFAQTSEDVAIFLSAPYTVDRIYYTEPNVNPQYWGDWFGGGPAGNSGASIPAYLKKPGFAWNGNAANIKAAINQGRFLVTHRDHGEKFEGWGDPQYTQADVSALTNGNKLPVVWSVNCETGWFDNETDPANAQTSSGTLHFSEAWERDTNGGAVGIIAATRVSYSGPNDRLVWGWMDAIWPSFEPSTPAASPIWEMGAVLNYGKLYMATKYSESLKRKTEFEMFHWFGDPTMEIWTDVPQSLTISHDANVIEGATSVDVNVNTAGALIAVSKANAKNGEILGKTMSVNGVNKVSLSKSLAAGEQVSVLVTKHNYRPYEGTITVKEATPCAIPTVTSNGAGGWTPQAPAADDIALILAGHTVTTDFVDTTNLCIEKNGKLISTAGQELFIMASNLVLNKGEIRGADGNDGGCPTGTHDASKYVHATPAKNILILADKFVNEGNIYGGQGGDDSTWKCLDDNDPGAWTYTFSPPIPGLPVGQTRTHQSNFGTWAQQYSARKIGYGFPSVGESGGKVEINSYIFTNKGLITGGVGGDGDSRGPGSSYVHGTSVGGRGGFLTINVNDLAGSTNTGTLKGGCGGHVDEPGCWDTGDFYNPYSGVPAPNNSTSCPGNNINGSRSGNGGDATFNAANQLGVMIGCKGSTTRWDPTTLKADSNTRFEGSDHVEIFGPGDWVMDLEGLVEGAVSANKTITLAVGKGGVIDLRGVSAKVFKAAEKVEIFADNILLDEGVTVADIAEAPIVKIEPAKILYRVALNAKQRIVGEAGTTVAVHLNILNNGPTEDTYTLTLGNTAGWSVSNLPNTVKVESLKKESLSFNVTLPQESGENILTITATSQGDPEISEVLGIRVVSEGGVVVSPEYNATGTVKDTTGKPVAEATITVGDKIVTTDANGSWEITGLVDGGHTVVASKDGYIITPKDFVVDGKNVILNLEAEVVISQDEYTTSGTISDKEGNPIDGVTVKVGEKTSVTDATGTWEITGLAKGEYVVTATKEGLEFESQNFVVDGENVMLNLKAKAVISQDEYTTSGTISDKEGNPIAGVTVKVGENTSVTDAAGIWEISGLAKGEYTATATKEGLEFESQNFVVDGENVMLNLKAEVVSEGEYTAFGTLLNELGEPIVGAKVQIGDSTTTTDAAGNWEVTGLQEGDDYTVTASKEGYTFAPENMALGNEVFKQKVTLKPVSALSVKVVAKPPVVKQDDNVTYTMTVTNGGKETATNVALNPVLPAGTTLVSLEALDGGNCDPDTLTCTLSELATGGSARFQMVINNTQAKSLVTKTTVTANEYPADVAKKWTRVIPYLSISISDKPDPLEMAQADVDRMLHYTLAVELGENAPSAATGIKLVATLPKGVELQAVNSENGMCDTSELPTLTCWMTDLSVDSADDISKVTLNVDVALKDAGILVLTHQAKVTANEYPAHTDRERTKVFIPESVQVDIAFVIDDTGSMQEEINGVKKALIAFIEEIDTSEAPLSVLLTFGDQVKYRAVTQDMTVLRDAIGNLKASGGGTCPEASYEAISFAIPHVKKGGTILFATDASPYEGSDVEEMIVRLRNKGIIFNAMIFGDCTDENSWNEQPE